MIRKWATGHESTEEKEINFRVEKCVLYVETSSPHAAVPWNVDDKVW